MSRDFVLLFRVLLLGLIGNFVPLEIALVHASSTFNITNESAYTTVENDYYICNISKTSGGIRNFYIKPYDSKNIVDDGVGGGSNVLGCHEIIYYKNASCGQANYQHEGSGTQHYDTSVMYQDSEVVVVRSAFRLYNDAPPPYYSINITEWRTFYADKPWFVVTFTQEFESDKGQFWTENQICFLYEHSFPDKYRMLNENGTIVKEQGDEAHHYASKYLKKYPWVFAYNSTDDIGIGHILIDVYPRSLMATWGYWHEGAGTYKEWQITLNDFLLGAPNGTKQTVTYINYAANNETIIDNFASDLYKANNKVTQGTTGYMPTAMNPLRDGRKVGGLYKAGSFGLYPIKYSFYGWYYCEQARNPREIQPYFINTSGFYRVTAETWTFPNSYWNSTYSNLTMRSERYNMLLDVQGEAWTANDAVKVTFNFTTLAALNITDIYVNFRPYPDYTYWNIVELNNDVAIFNASDSRVHWMYDYGHAFKNLTDYASRITGAADLKYYLLDNTGDIEYNSGQSWTLTMKIHKFIRTVEQGTYFQASDFLDTGSDLINFNHRFWIPLPFPEVPSNPIFYINHFGQQHGQIISSSYANEKLTINIAGENTKLTQWEVYCGSKHRPSAVIGASSWSYDSTTKVLTITTTHSSLVTIIVDWSVHHGPPPPPPSPQYCLTVTVVDRSNVRLPNVKVTVWTITGNYITSDYTNLAGEAVFHLPELTYKITAEHQGCLGMKRLRLNRDKSIMVIIHQPTPKEWTLVHVR